MYSFGDFKHELDYILANGYNCDIFCKNSLINGKRNFKSEVADTKPSVKVKKNSLQKIVKYFGINNFENCCFLNSTLQVILNYPPFIILLKQYELRTRGQSKIIEQIVSYQSQIESTIVDLNIGKSEDCIIYFGSKLPVFNPCLDLVSMLGFSKNQHEDAEEFLTKFLTQIHEDLLTCEINCKVDNEMEEDSSEKDEWVEIGKGGKNVSPPREDGGEMSTDTILSDLISGKMIEKVSKRNRLSNSTVTPFFILPLNIQSDHVTDVRTAIHSLTHPEKLSEVYERRMQIGHLPSLLILQLKRFTYTVDVGIQKIQKKIDINQLLTIPEDSISSTIKQSGDVAYEIFAVVYHIGEGVTKGHYTAAVRDNGCWYYLDDSNVFLIQGKQSADWLLNSSSADIPSQLLHSLDLKACAPRTACVSGRRSPYLIFYRKI